VLETTKPNGSFRRSLIRPREESWDDLLHRLDSVYLTHGFDVFRWNITGSGTFSVTSMYSALNQPDLPIDNNLNFLKMKIPLKAKVFVWYLRRGVVLTKDNLAKYNWHGSKKVCLLSL
jgi:hypothetical protein